MHNNLPLARRDVIALRLDQGQGAVSADLAQEFGVSEDAIRRDLRALAAEGRCRRVYGGALPLRAALPVSPASSAMPQRLQEERDRKAALARRAAQLVQPHDVVFLDNGSTNLAIVPFLPLDAQITVATNSIHIAAEVLRQGGALTLIMAGGVIDPAFGASVDADAIRQVQLLNIDLCFLGACALAASSGIAVFDPADAVFKRALLAASTRVVVLATSDKLETRAPHRVCALGAVSECIVEHDAPAEHLATLALAGQPIITAAAPV